MINYLKQPRGETELQLCAQILYRNDALEITFTRLRLATEQANRTTDPEQREVFARNLAQMKEWLSDPQFERNPTYRPRLR